MERISGPEKSRLSDGNDFFNSTGPLLTFVTSAAMSGFGVHRTNAQIIGEVADPEQTLVISPTIFVSDRAS